MTTIEWMMIIAAGLSFVLGAVIINWIWLRRLYGVFKIDCTDPNKDTCRIELDSLDLDVLATKKYVVLEIDAMFPDSRD